MHPLLASTALGLVAAWPVGVLGLGRLVERLTDDPRPRAAVWSLGHALPAGALAATVALTFAPAPQAPVSAPAIAAPTQTVAPAPRWSPEAELTSNLAWTLVGLSTAGLLARGWRWNRGRRRLAAIRAGAQPCTDSALLEAVRLRALRLGVTASAVRVSGDIAEPLLAGARRPVILLPKTLVEATDTRGLELVCGHELAHLKRGDNWRIPVEEALAGLFWLSPPVAGLRGRMLAAREAVCDRTALDGAAPEARRDYARVLVEALKINALSAPQSAFTGRARSLAHLRLSAILRPQGAASAMRVGVAVALGGLLTAATGAGSLALADQARRLSPPAPAAAEAARPASPAVALPAAAADAAPMQAAAAEPAPAALPEVAPTAPAASLASAAPEPMASPAPPPRPESHPEPAPDPQPRFEARASVEPSVAVQAETPANVRIVVPPNGGVDLSRRIKVLDPDASTRATASPKVAVGVRVSSDRDPWAR